MSTTHERATERVDPTPYAGPCRRHRPARSPVRGGADRRGARGRPAARAAPRRRSRCSAVQAVLFAIGAVAGVQRTPYAWLFRTLVRPRLAPPAELEDPAPPRFAQAVGLAFALVGAGRLPRRRDRRSGRSRPGSPWPPPCSTRSSASASAARSTCCCSQRARPPDPDRPPTTRRLDHPSPHNKEQSHEPRDHTRHRPVGRGQPRRPTASSWSRSTRTPRPTTRATSRAPSSSTGRPTSRTRSAATSSTRQQFEALLSERGVSNDDTVVLYGGNNNWFAAYAYWYFKLYGHEDVKLLDGGRKKWELDSRELTDELPDARADVVHRAGAGPLDPRLPRRGRRRHRHEEPRRRPQPRRVRRPAARPGPPPAGAGAARRPHPDRGQRAVEQGGQRRRHLQVRRRAEAALHRGRRRLEQGHHRLLPHRRALVAHVVRAQGAARARRTSRTTTARGPSTARWSASRSRSATSPGRPDVRRD